MNLLSLKFLSSEKVAEAAVLNRITLFVLAAILTCLFGSGIFKTTFNSSLNALLTKSDPYLNELEEMSRTFPSNGEIRFAFVANEGRTVFEPKILNAIAALKENFNSIHKALGITTILDFTSPETQRRLFSKPISDYSDAEIQAVSEIAKNDRLLTTNLLSPSGMLTFAIIDINTSCLLYTSDAADE